MTGISNNPFLGPAWVPVVAAIKMLLTDKDMDAFHFDTYAKRYGMDPDRSPYIQARWDFDGHLQLEASGNLICDPPLTEEQFREMEFIGWTRPDVDPAGYASRDPSDNPNFVRYYGPDANLDEVAEFFLTTLTTVYGLEETDYFAFETPDRVEALGGLKRLPISDGNPDGCIFGLIIGD